MACSISIHDHAHIDETRNWNVHLWERIETIDGHAKTRDPIHLI